MRRICYLLITLCFLTTSLFAQYKEAVPTYSRTASQIYVEGLGSGVLYSINYDKRLFPQDDGLGFRIGVSKFGGGSDGVFTVPIQINYLAGSNGRYFEAGAGIVYGGNNAGDGKDVVGSIVLGYRRQPFNKKGITWRFAFTPFITFDPELPFLPWIGASIGYRF